MPTVLNYLGLGSKLPQQPKSPGRDFSAALTGKSLPWENVMFYEMESTRAWWRAWEDCSAFPNGPYELYDMQADPRERFNLYGQPGLEDVRSEMAQRLDAFFRQYADPEYDLWNGGRSKAKRLETVQSR